MAWTLCGRVRGSISRYRLLALLFLAGCVTLFGQESTPPSLNGRWKGTFADSLFSGTVYLTLDLTSDGTVSGSYEATTGGSGTVEGNLDGKTFRFTLSQKVEGCPGTFFGSVILENDNGQGTYAGSDCKGKHQDGVVSMTRVTSGESSSPATSLTSAYPAVDSEKSSGPAETVYAKCGVGPMGLHSSAADLGLSSTVGSTSCGDVLTVLGRRNDYLNVRTAHGVEGYIWEKFVSSTKPSVQNAEPRVSQYGDSPQSNAIPSNELHAVAWRGVPWVTTTYYEQPGTANTDCTGSGTWIGNFYQGNSSCTTQYTPAQSVPINWTHYTIYNLVETADSWMVLACTRNWVFSKCSYLIPGDEFPFFVKDGKLSVTGQRSGKSKEQILTFDIISTQSK